MPPVAVKARELLSISRLEKDVSSNSLLHSLKFPKQNASLGRIHFIALQFNCKYYLYVGAHNLNNLFASPHQKYSIYKHLVNNSLRM